MSTLRLALAEPKHKDFILDLYNSDHFQKKGIRPISDETLESTRSEGFYFNLNTGSGFLIAIDTALGLPVGSMKISTNLVHKYSIISGGLIPEKVGNALGTELFSATSRFLFDRFPIERVEGNILKFNERSIKAAVRSGFTIEGIKRKAWFCNGTLCDQYFVSLLREEFIGLRLARENTLKD